MSVTVTMTMAVVNLVTALVFVNMVMITGVVLWTGAAGHYDDHCGLSVNARVHRY
jgi:nitrogen fixation-related uncharacterized protein